MNKVKTERNKIMRGIIYRYQWWVSRSAAIEADRKETLRQAGVLPAYEAQNGGR